MPANLELTLVDPNNVAVAIGGVDLSMGLAKIITEWPDEWINSSPGNKKELINPLFVHLIIFILQ